MALALFPMLINQKLEVACNVLRDVYLAQHLHALAVLRVCIWLLEEPAAVASTNASLVLMGRNACSATLDSFLMVLNVLPVMSIANLAVIQGATTVFKAIF